MMMAALKQFRRRRRLSQSQAAKALGVPVRTLQGWEAGRTPRKLTAEAVMSRMGRRHR